MQTVFSVRRSCSGLRAYVVLSCFIHSQLGLAQLAPPAQAPSIPHPRQAVIDGARFNPSFEELDAFLYKSLYNIDSDKQAKIPTLMGMHFLNETYLRFPNARHSDVVGVSEQIKSAADAYFNHPEQRTEDFSTKVGTLLEGLGSVADIAGSANVSVGAVIGYTKMLYTVSMKDFEQLERNLLFSTGQAALGPDGYDALVFIGMKPEVYGSLALNKEHRLALSHYLGPINGYRGIVDMVFDAYNPNAGQAYRQHPRDVAFLGLNLARTDKALGAAVVERAPSSARTPLARVPGSAGAGARQVDAKPVSMKWSEFASERLRELHQDLIKAGVYDENYKVRAPLDEDRKHKAEVLLVAARVLGQMSALAGSDKEARAAIAIFQAGVEMMSIGLTVTSTSLATLNIAGIVIGLVLTLASLFSSEPTFNEMLFKQVVEVRKIAVQILVNLRTQTNLLDHEFRDLRTLVNMRFDTLEALVGKRFDSVTELQLSTQGLLRDLEFQLSSTEKNQRHGLRQKDFRRISEVQLQKTQFAASPEAYSKAMGDLFLCAVQDSRSTEWTGSPNLHRGAGREVNYELATELGTEDPRYQANLLFQAHNQILGEPKEPPREVLEGVTLVPPGLSPVASIDLWAVCAQEYIKNAKSYRDHYTKFDPELGRLKAILDTGASIRLLNSRLAPDADAQGKDVSPLLEFVENYRESVESFRAALEGERSNADYRLHGIDPYKAIPDMGEVPVQVRDTLIDGMIKPCRKGSNWPATQSADGFIVSPQTYQVLERMIPKEAAVALQLQKGTLNFCLESVEYPERETIIRGLQALKREVVVQSAAVVVLRLDYRSAKDGAESIIGRWKIGEGTPKYPIAREEQTLYYHFGETGGFNSKNLFGILATREKNEWRELSKDDLYDIQLAKGMRAFWFEKGKYQIEPDKNVSEELDWERLEPLLVQAKTFDTEPQATGEEKTPKQDGDKSQKKKKPFLQKDVLALRGRIVTEDIDPTLRDARKRIEKEILKLAESRMGSMKSPAQSVDGARLLLLASAWQGMGRQLQAAPDLSQALTGLPSSGSLIESLNKNPTIAGDREALNAFFQLEVGEKIEQVRAKLAQLGTNPTAVWSHALLDETLQKVEIFYLDRMVHKPQ